MASQTYRLRARRRDESCSVGGRTPGRVVPRPGCSGERGSKWWARSSPLEPSQSRLPWPWRPYGILTGATTTQKDLNDCPNVPAGVSARHGGRRCGHPAPRHEWPPVLVAAASPPGCGGSNADTPQGPGSTASGGAIPESASGARRRGVGDSNSNSNSSSSDSGASSDSSSSTDGDIGKNRYFTPRRDGAASTAPSTGTADTDEHPPHRPRVRTRRSLEGPPQNPSC